MKNQKDLDNDFMDAFIYGTSIIDTINKNSYKLTDDESLPMGMPTWQNGWFGYIPEKIPTEEVNGECQHEWVEYIGFNDTFEYCKKCDIKKGRS